MQNSENHQHLNSLWYIISSNNTSSTPDVTGNSSADTVIVTLYSDVSCSTQIGTGTKAEFEGAGIRETATDNGTMTIYEKAREFHKKKRH